MCQYPSCIEKLKKAAQGLTKSEYIIIFLILTFIYSLTMRKSNAMIMAFSSADITDELSCNLSPKAILWFGKNAPLATFSFILDPSAKIWKWF